MICSRRGKELCDQYQNVVRRSSDYAVKKCWMFVDRKSFLVVVVKRHCCFVINHDMVEMVEMAPGCKSDLDTAFTVVHCGAAFRHAMNCVVCARACVSVCACARVCV